MENVNIDTNRILTNMIEDLAKETGKKLQNFLKVKQTFTFRIYNQRKFLIVQRACTINIYNRDENILDIQWDSVIKR